MKAAGMASTPNTSITCWLRCCWLPLLSAAPPDFELGRSEGPGGGCGLDIGPVAVTDVSASCTEQNTITGMAKLRCTRILWSQPVSNLEKSVIPVAMEVK